jgi:riboflavin kinase/FMN adenylyltransferase
MKKCDCKNDFKSVNISWLDFIKGEPNKLNDMDEYIQRDELVI